MVTPGRRPRPDQGAGGGGPHSEVEDDEFTRHPYLGAVVTEALCAVVTKDVPGGSVVAGVPAGCARPRD
ncbi:hypothetical protein [Actinomyces dentalis]|uniref:hypothetical protein n=1 Tax=Actinomyces dentalis TaxID=272548 RepID=UPI002356B202|nr:hypothetical protein [Actinomyces dentalis]